MSANPGPDDDLEPEGDGFPQEGDGTEPIKYMAGGRFSGGPITSVAAPGPVVGDLIARLAKLYSALESRSSNLGRAVADFPYYLRGLRFEHSVDLLYQGERHAPALVPDPNNPIHASLEALARLVGEREGIQAMAAEYGGAVAMAYRQLVSLLGQREITADFFVAVDRMPDETSFVRLAPDAARAQADALSDQQTLRVETASLTGLLTVLDGDKGTFKLARPGDLATEYKRAWKEAVGSKRVVEGELTDEAETDIRRLNAWKSKVTVEVELTHMTSPKTTRTEEIDAKLLRISQVHMRLDDGPPASAAR